MSLISKTLDKKETISNSGGKINKILLISTIMICKSGVKFYVCPIPIKSHNKKIKIKTTKCKVNLIHKSGVKLYVSPS